MLRLLPARDDRHLSIFDRNAEVDVVDTAIRADDLNEAAALEAKKRAEAALADQQSDLDVAKARAEIAAAAAQIAAIQKFRKR